jgi:hypothetical protein
VRRGRARLSRHFKEVMPTKNEPNLTDLLHNCDDLFRAYK